jgi:hypothetical protein
MRDPGNEKARDVGRAGLRSRGRDESFYETPLLAHAGARAAMAMSNRSVMRWMLLSSFLM